MGTTSKALALLDLFNRQRPQIGLSELARLSGANKATCYRLMGELTAHGLIEQVGGTREYRIGPAVIRLARLRDAAVPARVATQAALDRLAAGTGETAHMSEITGDRLITTAYAYPATHAIRVTMDNADRLDFHATASGLAVLAFADPALAARVLAGPLPARTGQTLIARAAIEAAVAAARGTGIAETDGTFEAEVASLAVPLFGPAADCVGALAVAAPSGRMTPPARRAILPRLVRTAEEMIELRGGAVPPAVAQLWHEAIQRTAIQEGATP